MKRAVFFAALVTTPFLVLTHHASAEPRQFYCGEESFVAVDVIDAKRVSVGPISGETLIFQPIAQSHRYSSGKTTIELSADRTSVQILQDGSDSIGCVFPVPADVVTPGGSNANAQGEAAPGAKPGADGKAAVAIADSGQTQSFPAKSWGGIVRDGPGMDYRKIASLAQGDAITVLEPTGVEMNGYMWFKIRYGGNKTGFHWGGVVCPIGTERPGAFEKCN